MNRKKLSLLVGVMLFWAPMVVADDALESILSKYYEAIGGLEAWRGLESCRLSGEMVVPQGMAVPFTMIFQMPLKSRLEISIQGMEQVQAFDGEKGWAVAPFSGSTEPQLMPEEFLPIMKEQSDIAGPLVDWEAKGHQIELLGKNDDPEGPGEFHLQVTLESGDIRDFFLDGESYLPIRMEATTEFMGNELEIATIFSDYREVGDLMMVHSIETGPVNSPEGQVMRIETIELNIEVDADLFSFPGASLEPELESDSEKSTAEQDESPE